MTQHTPDKTGIYRIFHRGTSGYLWRVTIRRNGKQFRKDFFESIYGEQEALMLAQAWRDMVIAENPAMKLADFCAIKRSNNSSGIPGVYFKDRGLQSTDKSGPATQRWVAFVPLKDGEVRRESFSAASDSAKQRAVQKRAQALANLGDTLFRENKQPQTISSPADIARLKAALRAPQERRLREEAERAQRDKQRVHLAAQKMEQALAAEQRALQITTSSGEPYIARYKNKAGHGAGWRVSIIRQGKAYKKGFADAAHGGTTAALDAAKAWRDNTFHALPVMSLTQVLTRARADNTSGVPGVHHRHETVGGKQVSFWVAYAPQKPGIAKRSKTFSVSKYGERQAFELAVKAREAFVAEMADVPHLPKHAAKQMMHKQGKAPRLGE